MADEAGGVWRTISGRKVFISDGQSLTQAMRESGKFKGMKSGEEEVPETLQIRHDQGKSAKKKLEELVGKDRAEYPSSLPELFYDDEYGNLMDYMSEGASFEQQQFFWAGFNGREPEYVQAIRYGDIPDSGQSKNWASGELEKGVSAVKIIRSPSDYNYKSIYDVIYGTQGTNKTLISGWYFGGGGSDGEPLLISPKKIKNL